MTEVEDFRAFYTRQAARFSEIMHATLDERYTDTVDGLRGDGDLIARLQELVPPPASGLDAGCGAGARDVYLYRRAGYRMIGVDAVPANLEVARCQHPEIGDDLLLHDLGQPLPFEDTRFDFVLCNAVIQHIDPELALDVTLPEFARVLTPGGMLQLMFKSGRGETVVYDAEYGLHRAFRLYDTVQVTDRLAELDFEIVPAAAGKLGGVLHFTDPKKMRHCVLYARRRGSGEAAPSP